MLEIKLFIKKAGQKNLNLLSFVKYRIEGVYKNF